MKQFVLLNKHTGDLCIGTRVMMMDRNSFEVSYSPNSYTISTLSHDGWIVQNPKLPGPMFFNLQADKFFENLGEL